MREGVGPLQLLLCGCAPEIRKHQNTNCYCKMQLLQAVFAYKRLIVIDNTTVFRTRHMKARCTCFTRNPVFSGSSVILIPVLDIA